MYFVMRSCEYLHVVASDTRRTKFLILKISDSSNTDDIFFHKYYELHATDTNTITFFFKQTKNDKFNNKITMHVTVDPIICPLKAYISRIHRIRGNKKVKYSSPIDIFTDPDGNFQKTLSAHVRQTLQAVATLIGEDKLRFKIIKIGTHLLLLKKMTKIRLFEKIINL